jgi:hypothetical protein
LLSHVDSRFLKGNAANEFIAAQGEREASFAGQAVLAVVRMIVIEGKSSAKR